MMEKCPSRMSDRLMNTESLPNSSSTRPCVGEKISWYRFVICFLMIDYELVKLGGSVMISNRSISDSDVVLTVCGISVTVS